MKAIVAAACANILGEGPVWHKERNSFFWVDIEGRLVQEYELNSGLTKSWQMPARTGMLAFINDHELIVALQGAVVLFNLNDASISTILALDADKPMMRPNDGKCDSEGRLWVGTLHMNLSDPRWKPVYAGRKYIIEKT